MANTYLSKWPIHISTKSFNGESCSQSRLCQCATHSQAAPVNGQQYKIFLLSAMMTPMMMIMAMATMMMIDDDDDDLDANGRADPIYPA